MVNPDKQTQRCQLAGHIVFSYWMHAQPSKCVNSRRWYVDGKEHCDNGPAVEYIDGLCLWYKHGAIISSCMTGVFT